MQASINIIRQTLHTKDVYDYAITFIISGENAPEPLVTFESGFTNLFMFQGWRNKELVFSNPQRLKIYYRAFNMLLKNNH